MNDIELRSEKVRNIIGRMPSYFTRNGVYIVLGFIVLIFICLSIIPYSESVDATIVIKTDPNSEILKSPIDGLISYNINNKQHIYPKSTIASIENNDLCLDIKSIISGTVITHSKNRSFIKKGDLICEILPDSIKSIYGELYIPVESGKKIHENIPVNIMMNKGMYLVGFVSRKEYGNQADSVKIEVSILNKDYKFNSQEYGHARILIYNKKLLHRLLLLFN